MKLKKTVLAVILSSMVLSTTAGAADFADVRGHWAESVINNLADAGIVSGVTDTRFNPDGIVTRAEFLRMALGAGGIEDTVYRKGECLDVNEGEWFAPCVQSALDKGLIPEGMISGYSVTIKEDESGSKAVYSGTFNANAPIKREEMAYITQSVYQYSMEKDEYEKLAVSMDMPFSDLNAVSIWALDGLKHAYSNELISGMDDGTFMPQSSATRAQAAVIINNLLDK